MAAQRLDCGCEHHQYGELLGDVGRVADAVTQLRQASDMLALYMYTPLSLAEALVAAGKPDDAKSQFDAAIELAPNSEIAGWISLTKALATHDTGPLLDPKVSMQPEQRAALLGGYRAVATRNDGARVQAVQALLALPQEQQNNAVARLLGDLGANHQAFQLAARLATGSSGPALFWYPGMRGTLDDRGFPALATRLGLTKYWETTHTEPDVCKEKAPPLFCRTIGHPRLGST
ncbi:MAG: hypothetical protein H0W71_06145 [Sphingomonas sp.]|nr:hypothetical protein [Sphingomonas sp.]